MTSTRFSTLSWAHVRLTLKQKMRKPTNHTNLFFLFSPLSQKSHTNKSFFFSHEPIHVSFSLEEEKTFVTGNESLFSLEEKGQKEKKREWLSEKPIRFSLFLFPAGNTTSFELDEKKVTETFTEYWKQPQSFFKAEAFDYALIILSASKPGKKINCNNISLSHVDHRTLQ